MSVEIVRKYFANVKFWFRSWKKDKDQAILKSIINALASIKDMVAALVVSELSVDDRILLGDVARETEAIAEAIKSTPVFAV